MTTVWVLLGKTRYPAKFLEMFAGKSWVMDSPFDLTIDVLPDLLRAPDSYLQHLVAEGPQDVAGFEDIAGESRVLRDAVGRAKRASLRGVSTRRSGLLGESGTGKEMIAHAIHKASPRRDRPFVAINDRHSPSCYWRSLRTLPPDDEGLGINTHAFAAQWCSSDGQTCENYRGSHSTAGLACGIYRC